MNNPHEKNVRSEIDVPIFKIAGVVVLYNPESDVAGNINSYVHQVNKLYIIDNSESDNSDLIDKIKGKSIEYVWNGSNKGIAYGLNVGAKKAVAEGFEILLTMDQDSHFMLSELNRLFQSLQLFTVVNQIGIISPYHENRRIRMGEPEFENSKLTMTSGNLLNLAAYVQIGEFNEKLFIDYVDHEYCLRLRKGGYKILQATKVTMHHNLGNSVSINFLGRSIVSSNHAPVRRYYMTRNRFYTISRFGLFDPALAIRELFRHITETLKIILIEMNKWEKLRMSFLGFFDFIRGRYGKYNS